MDPCPRPIGGGLRPLARQQRRVLGRNGEAETDEACRQDGHHPAGLGCALAAEETIIGKASQQTVALHPGEDVLDTPFVQDMGQASIGEHGRNDPTLHATCLRVGELAVFHDSGTQPLPNETQ